MIFIKILYKNRFNILSGFMYRKLFVEELNLAFKKPGNDICQICDKFQTTLKFFAFIKTQLKEKINIYK